MSSFLLLGAGTDAAAGGGGANNIAINGTPIYASASAISVTTATFTTSVNNCVIFVFVGQNDQITAPTVTATGLTFSQLKTATIAAPYVGLWAAVAASPFSNTITVTGPAGVGFIAANVFAFSGVNTTSFPTGMTDATAGSATQPVSLTTTNANDVIIACSYTGVTGGAMTATGLTFTSCNAGGTWITSGYDIVTSTFTGGISDSNATNGVVVGGFKST